MTTPDLDSRNAEFWDEPCGSSAAKLLGLDMQSPKDIELFDKWYFEFYPYLERYLDQVIEKDATCLEVGVGSGTVSRYLAKRVKYLDLLDIAPASLNYVKGTLSAHQNVKFINNSVLDLTDSKRYNLIVAIGSLHHTGDLERSILNLERILEPNGRILLMVYYAFQPRRILTHPLRSLSEYRKTISTSHCKFVFEEFDVNLRAAADSNLSGQPAPYTAFSSRRLFSGREMMKYEVKLENSHGIPFLRKFVSRKWHLKLFSRFFGCDIYAVGQKSIS